MSEAPTSAAAERFGAFVDLIARLRGPGGCPWDRQQTHESLKPMTLEEAYEVVEAIDDGDDAELAGELGDLLLQVVFHSQLAAESGRFTLADVIDAVSEKMVRRHPHVFGTVRADTAAHVLRNWEDQKEAERAGKGEAPGPEASMLDAVPSHRPALMEAFQLTTKVGRVGFDWPDAAAVLGKLDEEVAELKAAVGKAAPRHREIAGEVGDALFVLVNLARLLGVDPESALKSSNRKFRRRFGHVERRLREQGRKPAESTLEEMDALWQQAKARERRIE